MKLSPAQYHLLERELRSINDAVSGDLDKESAEGTLHYLQHGELEMAFEILGLGLLNSTISLDESMGSRLVAIGRQLGVDNESVWDPLFWDRLTQWRDQRQP